MINNKQFQHSKIIYYKNNIYGKNGWSVGKMRILNYTQASVAGCWSQTLRRDKFPKLRMCTNAHALVFNRKGILGVYYFARSGTFPRKY